MCCRVQIHLDWQSHEFDCKVNSKQRGKTLVLLSYVQNLKQKEKHKSPQLFLLKAGGRTGFLTPKMTKTKFEENFVE